jgi:hypothetical protein
MKSEKKNSRSYSESKNRKKKRRADKSHSKAPPLKRAEKVC